MLSSGRMEEFVTEEEEPWYDQQDLEQGKTRQPSSQPAASPLSAAGPVNRPPLNKGSLSYKEPAEVLTQCNHTSFKVASKGTGDKNTTIFDNNALKGCQAGPRVAGDSQHQTLSNTLGCSVWKMQLNITKHVVSLKRME